jgi:ribosomal protein L7/L12
MGKKSFIELKKVREITDMELVEAKQDVDSI